MHRLIIGFSKISYRDLLIFLGCVLAAVNVLGSIGWTISAIYSLVVTGRWSWPETTVIGWVAILSAVTIIAFTLSIRKVRR